MTETSESLHNDRIQQEYWDKWLNFNRQALETSPWSEALGFLWQALSPSIPQDNQEVFKKFIEQGKNYFLFSEEFIKIFQGLSAEDGQLSGDWDQLWQKGLTQLQENLVNSMRTGNQFGFWGLPLDNWQRTAAFFSNFPGDILQNLKAEAIKVLGEDLLHHEMQRFLSIPNHGVTREWQAQLQQGIRLWLTYQRAQEEYVNLFNKIGLHALDLLRDKIKAKSQAGESFDSLKAVYELWLNCGEEAYAKFVHSEEYCKVYSNLINSLMAWKLYERKRIDEWLASLKLPTRQEFDTVIARLQQLRREIRHLQSTSLTNASLEDLKKEINEIRAELAANKRVEEPTLPLVESTHASKRKAAAGKKPFANPSQPKTHQLK
jgi:class III poly(R)-hydroxyalkanoic acid synthase PhaE subunit